MWNTGCKLIHNNNSDDLTVIDWEATDNRLVVPKGGEADFAGIIFPWCIDSAEVMNKAFRFYQGWLDSTNWPLTVLKGRPDLLQFYMFQYYEDDQVYWLKPDANGQAIWANRIYCNEGPSSYVDVFIDQVDFSSPFNVQVRAVS